MKKPEAIKDYRFRLFVSPRGGIQEVFHVETSAAKREEARDKVFWLVAAGLVVHNITFCGVVAQEEK